MSPSLLLACVWAATANLIAIFPSRHHHWPAAYALMILGGPILVWVFAADGVIFGLIVLAAGASVLRWPVRYFLRWIGRGLSRAGGKAEG